MLVLHAAFHPSGLHLWGESTPREEEPTTTQPYPYRTEVSALRDGLARADLSLAVDPTATSEPTLWLPTQGGVPLPSSPLVAEPPPSRKPPTLAPWSIPTVALTAAAAVPLLATVRDRPALAPGVVAGDDLRYWGEALQLAGALVYRRHVLPDLVEQRRGAYRACWTPVFVGEDGARLERLARALPPAARAIGDRRAPPDSAPRDVLREFLAWIADHLVRQAAVLPAVKRIGVTSASLHGQWLHALQQPDGALCVFQSIRPPIPAKIRPLIPVGFGHPFQWGFGRRFRAIRPGRRRAATWEENCYWLTGVAVKGVRVFRRESPFKCKR